MALLDIFRQQYLEGKVLNKYRLENGNIGVIVENRADNRRYHVEFKDRDSKLGLNNFYGLFKTPFERKSDSLDRLITKGDYLGVSLTYNQSPFKQAQQLHSVSSKPPYRAHTAQYRNLAGLLPSPY